MKVWSVNDDDEGRGRKTKGGRRLTMEEQRRA